MTKLLNGSELAGYIKERQARQVRNLRQAHHIVPKLAIIVTAPTPVVETYMRLKQVYGEDILIEVEVLRVSMADLYRTIKTCNQDVAIHGIIIQLPLEDPAQTNEAVNLVAPEKDVDGLGAHSTFDPATPMAINWLLTGYGVDLVNKRIAIVGRGRLVGAPLEKIWRNSGYSVETFGASSGDLTEPLQSAEVIIAATGSPGLITSDMITAGSVVVDAGTASEDGVIVGDLALEVRERDDLEAITPAKGGVGPLTVAALFDNVIQAARRSV